MGFYKLKTKQEHDKWLWKMGVHPAQINAKKKVLGPPKFEYKQGPGRKEGAIPENGTKTTDISRANFSNSNYALVPAYNKGPIQPISKEDLQKGAGRK